MIDRLLLAFCALFVYSSIQSQVCYPVGVTFSSQEDIDSFIADNPGCTSIGGDVSIYGTDITNLDSLINIISFGGDLTISSNSLLENIDGLVNVESIDGDFTLSDNGALVNIDGLASLQTINGFFRIESNTNLLNLSGLGSLTSVNGFFQIGGYSWVGNPSITSLSGLENLIDVDGDFIIAGNDNLIDVSNLSSLLSVDGDLKLSENPALTEIAGFDNLNSITDNLIISNCPLTLISAFQSLTAAGGLDIYSTELNNFEGLESLETLGLNGLSVRANSLLNNFAGLDNLTSIAGNVKIGGSYANEGNPSLQNLNGLENLQFIGGDLSIGYCDSVASLLGLNALDSIGGSLLLIAVYNSASLLDNIDALANLSFVGANIEIKFQPKLSKITALTSLDKVEGSINIEFNFLLDSIAFEQLSYLGGDFKLRANSVLGNINLPTVLDTILGELYVESNPMLNSLSSFSNIYHCGNIYINDNDSLLNMNGFENISTIDGNFNIGNNALLTSLEGFDSLTYVGGEFFIHSNDKLLGFENMSGLDSVGGVFNINGNQLVRSMHGFESLKKIGDEFTIRNNPSLQNFDGLEGLLSIGGNRLRISDNDSLINIDGIINIDPETIPGLFIRHNNQLSKCNIMNICAFLDANPWNNIVEYNAPGCSTVNDLKSKCLEIECAPAGITFSTQDQVNSFQTDYPGCTVIAGDVVIEGTNISNLDSLDVLLGFGAELKIGGDIGNPMLTDISGLENIYFTEGSLKLQNNDSLIDLTPLFGVYSIGGDLVIENNNLLETLSGLNNINPLTIDGLYISGNDSLSVCDVQSICDYIGNPSGVITIADNAPECNSLEDVEYACTTGPCLAWGISFTTQDQVNNFVNDHPNCTIIAGNLTIKGSSISNLDGLNVLTEVWGDLNIGTEYGGNAILLDLDGLENLTSVEGDVSIFNNPNLNSLQGLDNLNSIGGDLLIGGGTGVAEPNPNLESLTGLESLASIGGNFVLNGSELIENVDPLSNLQLVDGILSINNNASLTNITALSNLTEIGNNLIITSNPFLESLSGLENIIKVGGNLELAHDSLTAYDVFVNLDSIGGSLYMLYSTIDSIYFPNLKYVGDDFIVSYCHNLTEISNLDQLNYIEDYLSIQHNDSLSSIEGLANIESNSLLDISIIYNPLLSECSIASVCDFLASHQDVYVQIVNNGPNCVNRYQVEDQCSQIPCLNNGITLTSQAEIDNFEFDHPFCFEINGDLSIQGSDITNLNGLSMLTAVYGELNIINNPILTTIQGIESVYAGDLSSLTITNNPYLSNCAIQNVCAYLALEEGIYTIADNGTDCESVENINAQCMLNSCYEGEIILSSQEEVNHFAVNYPYCYSIQGSLKINGFYIDSLNPLNVITYVGGDLEFSSGSYTDLEGFENLTEIGGSLYFNGTQQLENVDGLINLHKIGGHLEIGHNGGNNAITNLDGLNSLDSIGGKLQISANQSLIDISGLSNLVHMNGVLRVSQNEVLSNLVGLENIDPEGISYVQFYWNNELSICNVQSICDYFAISSASNTIYGNNEGCDSEAEIELACEGDPPCIVPGMVFNSQNEVDSFPIYYPNCGRVAGDVYVLGEDIANLDSLYQITTIEGKLVIGDPLNSLTNLESIEGLINLVEVGDNLSIEYCEALASLTGLDSLSIVDGTVRIAVNEMLTDLASLANLDSITWNFEVIDNPNLINLHGLEHFDTFPHDLWINGNTALENLQGLENLVSVGGFLFIGGTEQLEDLSELSNLVSTGEGMNINENDALINLVGLENLTTLNTADVFNPFLSITVNNQLEDISSLSNLTEIGGSLYINSNPYLESLNGLENVDPNSIINIYMTGNALLNDCAVQSICEFLISPTGSVTIENNDTGCDNADEILSMCLLEPCLAEGFNFSTQAEIDDFPSLHPYCYQIEGDVSISGSDITNVDSLISLTSLGGYLIIEDNPLLTDLSGLANVNFINGELNINNNDALISLDGLNYLNASSISELTISNNQALTECAISSICQFIGFNDADILNNAVGCDSVEEVEAACLLVACLPDGIELNSQSDIDNFQDLYPGCDEIGGDLTINGDDIENLDGLSVIHYIGGDLNINSNLMLDDLSGLSNVLFIGGHLRVWQNEILSNLSGLEGVESLGDYIKINTNPSLMSLEGLENIESSSIGDLTIFDNSLLNNCDVQSICNYLVEPNGTVLIYDNAEGCNTEEEIIYECGIVECLVGGIVFTSQAEIDAFSASYPNCNFIGGDVEISGNDITNLNGLNAIEIIDGGLWINDNEILESLEGLNNLSTVEGLVYVGYNDALLNLNGLEQLNFIGGNLKINNNDQLSDIDALWNVAEILGDLSIFSNNTLSNCMVLSICTYIGNPNGEILINNNMEGCNNEEEVATACIYLSLNESDPLLDFMLYPNPADKKIHLSMQNREEVDEIAIYNQLGQQLILIKGFSEQIDVSSLENGIYIVELLAIDQRVKKILIIN